MENKYDNEDKVFETEETVKKENIFMKFLKSKTFIICTIIAICFCFMMLVEFGINNFLSEFFSLIITYGIIMILVIFPMWSMFNASNLNSKSENENQMNETTNANDNENATIEYRKKCNICGNIFCYTDKDIEKNNLRMKLAKNYSRSMITQGLIDNNKIDWRYNQEKMEQSLDKIIDFSRCPKCGSTDLTDYIKDENVETNVTNNSNIDEITKYKELLDKGILTQEEFDKKKKELLKL